MIPEVADGNEIRILVVDDDASIQDVIVQVLREGGFETEIASTGEDALSMLKISKYSVLIMDISFGSDRIKGWDVARRARSVDPSLPVVYVTGGNADEWSVHGVSGSIVLTKPFESAQLGAAVSQLLNPH